MEDEGIQGILVCPVLVVQCVQYWWCSVSSTGGVVHPVYWWCSVSSTGGVVYPGVLCPVLMV